MTPFTLPHPLSSLLTLYVYEGEGAEALVTVKHAATGAVIQLGNHSQVKRGRGRGRASLADPAAPALF